MKKYGLICLLISCVASLSAQASSLDELYRDIVRSDNQGYLPLFVKNRDIPDILIEEELLKQNLPTTRHNLKDPISDVVNLSNDRLIREQAIAAANKRWQETMIAVRENRVTPLELQEITRRVQKDDPHATEILAWMNARGVGVPLNLPEAFTLYQQAAALNVPHATENALKVYQSMSPQQRRNLKSASGLKI